jgi:hypothetical protein
MKMREHRHFRGLQKVSGLTPREDMVADGKLFYAGLGDMRGVSKTVPATVVQGYVNYVNVRLETESRHGTPIVHVKNGKPLTAEGARMLGVEWVEKERGKGR